MVTGLLYLSPDSSDLHEQINTVATPLTQLPHEELCPGSAELEKLQRGSDSASGPSGSWELGAASRVTASEALATLRAP